MRLLPVVLFTATALAQLPPGFSPDTRYDPAVPTVLRVTGHAAGDAISLAADIDNYLQALAAASPRVATFPFGRTWEGRPLRYAVIGSPQNLQRLETLQRGMQQLSDPRRLSKGDRQRLLDDLPAVAWLAAGVHGDEPSGGDALLQLAYFLTAAQDQPLAQKVLSNCVVILDPAQNPDGRDRFVHGTRAAAGLAPDADPSAAEHTQPWPGGRSNHYLFDMNRDWFALTQPETQARVAAFLQWHPLCFVDMHEMGGNSTYYFAPPADPVNPEVTEAQRTWLGLYGRNNGAAFDRLGYDYFTRESYDSFYPGYGDGWPTYQGSIAMTFEQGSARGLVFRREDDTQLSYRDCVMHQFTAALATLETLANGRAEALAAYAKYREDALDVGAGPVEYVFPDRGDRTRLARLMRILVQQGIEVQRASGELQSPAAVPYAGGAPAPQTFPDGSYVVAMAQPARHLATVLLRRQFDMDPKFVAEQLRKQQRRQDLDFYDMTAWSLPLLFDVEAFTTSAPSTGTLQPLAFLDASPRTTPPAAAKVAYVVPWDQNGAAGLMIDLLLQGYRVRSLDKPFRIAGTDFPAGSFVVKVMDNAAGLHDFLVQKAQRRGVQVTATDSSWVESGVSFGSNHSLVPKPPKVAMAWDRPVGANSAGATRFLLERRYGLSVTPIRTQSLARADLDRFTVLILPDGGGYGDVLGKRGAAAIEQWVARGGVLITLGAATRWLTSDGVGLLATKAEDRKNGKAAPAKDVGVDAPKPDADKASEKAAGETPAEEAQGKPEVVKKDKDKDKGEDAPFDYQKAIQPDKESPPYTPGAILAVTTDPEHWLSFGYRGRANVVVESTDIFTPLKLDQGTNVAVYETADKLVLSGFVFEEKQQQLAQKAYLVHQPHGKGHVVAFAEDPNTRAFVDGLNLMFLNAVLLTAGR